MLPIIALVQLTFYRCVSYFQTRKVEIRARMAVGDVILRMQLINLQEMKPKLVDIV